MAARISIDLADRSPAEPTTATQAVFRLKRLQLTSSLDALVSETSWDQEARDDQQAGDDGQRGYHCDEN